MTLAPNSITKVRVYIYIEGQDVDNYDFASLGKQISVNFGFTKERFTGDDIGYDGTPALQYTVDYSAAGAVTEISETEIQYRDGKFTVPVKYESFTFKDNDQVKTAKYMPNGEWVIS